MNQIKPNLAMSGIPDLYSRRLPSLNIEISSIVHCCFIINQNDLNSADLYQLCKLGIFR
jgi:hypothetical protein